MPPIDPNPANRRNGVWEVIRDLALPVGVLADISIALLRLA